ncbi:type IV secretion system protein virB8 [Striga asiatica]|uniref:Type IV secretion system protein virB8 n=1 Tax=Striga asiatica TaxID=4170 RepID=A0A5A7QK70_STRAF|nr:type IV secretion system protein virB8 [Striga asiatica]
MIATDRFLEREILINRDRKKKEKIWPAGIGREEKSAGCAARAPAREARIPSLSRAHEKSIQPDVGLPSTCLGPALLRGPNDVILEKYYPQEYIMQMQYEFWNLKQEARTVGDEAQGRSKVPRSGPACSELAQLAPGSPATFRWI